MAVKIRLKRLGKKRAPYYRIVVADSRTKRDGRVIEEIGLYHPTEEPSYIKVNSDRAQYWLGVGAQPTDQVAVILKITGDWQKFKGLPGAEGTLRTKAVKSGAEQAIRAIATEAEKAKAAVAEARTEPAPEADSPAVEADSPVVAEAPEAPAPTPADATAETSVEAATQLAQDA